MLLFPILHSNSFIMVKVQSKSDSLLFLKVCALLCINKVNWMYEFISPFFQINIKMIVTAVQTHKENRLLFYFFTIVFVNCEKGVATSASFWSLLFNQKYRRIEVHLNVYQTPTIVHFKGRKRKKSKNTNSNLLNIAFVIINLAISFPRANV